MITEYSSELYLMCFKEAYLDSTCGVTMFPEGMNRILNAIKKDDEKSQKIIDKLMCFEDKLLNYGKVDSTKVSLFL
jgi:hypothetical protein